MNETLAALEVNAIDTLLLHEDTDLVRYEVSVGGDEKTLIICESADKISSTIEKLSKEHENVEVVKQEPFLEWCLQHIPETTLLISDVSIASAQFVKGFGGVGGTLRYNR